MKTQVEYRTFDELIDSVRIDLRGLDLEGMIDEQQLIKVAQRVNYELGLKVNPSRSKSIEIENGKGKLPSDFYVLNFALRCGDKQILGYPSDYVTKWSYKTYDQGFWEGMAEAQMILNDKMVKQYSIVMDLVPGLNPVSHHLQTNFVVVQVTTVDGSVLSFDFQNVDINNINIVSELPDVLENARVVVMGSAGSGGPNCPTDNFCVPAPPRCEIVQKPNCSPTMSEFKNGYRYEYRTLIPLQISASKSVSADCINVNTMSPYSAYIKNGFLVTNFEEGTVFINYQSLMEDDEGNLLVMSHPMVDEFYEYALKQRIYENLIMSGENMTNYLQIVEQRLRGARNNALSYVNTPDFREMYENWKMNRKAMYAKYYDMFKGSGPLPTYRRYFN